MMLLFKKAAYLKKKPNLWDRKNIEEYWREDDKIVFKPYPCSLLTNDSSELPALYISSLELLI